MSSSVQDGEKLFASVAKRNKNIQNEKGQRKSTISNLQENMRRRKRKQEHAIDEVVICQK